jgi:hypothetical protein
VLFQFHRSHWLLSLAHEQIIAQKGRLGSCLMPARSHQSFLE